MSSFTIGCSPQHSQLVVEGAGVSRLHLAVSRIDDQQIALKDQNSRFGSSFWDGQQWQAFSEIVLRENHYINLGGGITLRVKDILIAREIQIRNSKV